MDPTEPCRNRGPINGAGGGAESGCWRVLVSHATRAARQSNMAIDNKRFKRNELTSDIWGDTGRVGNRPIVHHPNQRVKRFITEAAEAFETQKFKQLKTRQNNHISGQTISISDTFNPMILC